MKTTVHSSLSVGSELAAEVTDTRSTRAEQLSEYFRVPDPWVEFSCDNGDEEKTGFFTFCEDSICFGRCSSVAPVSSMKQPLPDTFQYAQIGKNSVRLPFNLDNVAYNLHTERYILAASSSCMQRIIRNAYYHLRPRLAVGVRKHLQRVYLAGWKNIPFPRWPVDLSVDLLMKRVLSLGIQASGATALPFIWFWPEGHSSACIITHDVEATAGRDFCSRLMDLDDSCGMKSAFQVVPEERYEVTESYLTGIRARGFEVNVHDLNHDGMLFADEKTFLRRVVEINRYGKQWGASGFRAGVMYRNQQWFHALDFEYDMSVPNVAHLEPQRGGCCTVMPYFIGNLVELPLTTTQDYTLFHILGERSLNIWEREIEAVHRNHGLISILVHPDYIIEPWAQEVYLQLLRHLDGKITKENIWRTTPREVNNWWRIRSKLSLAQKNGSWQIVGDGCERARIAYASLDGENLQYRFDPPAE